MANADNDIDDQERDLILDKIKKTIDGCLNEKQIFDVIQEESVKGIILRHH